jgi:hypothetical protein
MLSLFNQPKKTCDSETRGTGILLCIHIDIPLHENELLPPCLQNAADSPLFDWAAELRLHHLAKIKRLQLDLSKPSFQL